MDTMTSPCCRPVTTTPFVSGGIFNAVPSSVVSCNVLVHPYLGADLDYVWRVVEDNLPALKQQVHAMLRELGVERS